MLHVSEVTPFFMVICLKFYCETCSLQNLQKPSRCTKSVSNRTFFLHKSRLPNFFYDPANTSIKHVSPCSVVYLVKVFVIAKTFEEFTFTVKYCPSTSACGAYNLSSITYKQKRIPLVLRIYEYPKRCSQRISQTNVPK